MSRDRDIEKLYHRLALNLRSAIHRPTNNGNEDCKCLVRFHNCTPYDVTPFWIDSKGLPIKYRPLPRGASMNMDTYESHLWFFKARDRDEQVNNSSADDQRSDMVKLLAIPEDILDMSHEISHLNAYFKNKQQQPDDISRAAVGNNVMARNSEVHDAILGMNNVLICSLCKHIVKSYSMEPVKVPCPHFTGEAKFSISDLVGQSSRGSSRFDPNYIYSCTTKTHRRDHSRVRRNIYLVEPFYNLRERCFLALKNHVRFSEFGEMNLPISLQEDYIQFMTTLSKVNDINVNT